MSKDSYIIKFDNEEEYELNKDKLIEEYYDWKRDRASSQDYVVLH